MTDAAPVNSANTVVRDETYQSETKTETRCISECRREPKTHWEVQCISEVLNREVCPKGSQRFVLKLDFFSALQTLALTDRNQMVLCKTKNHFVAN